MIAFCISTFVSTCIINKVLKFLGSFTKNFLNGGEMLQTKVVECPIHCVYASVPPVRPPKEFA